MPIKQFCLGINFVTVTMPFILLNIQIMKFYIFILLFSKLFIRIFYHHVIFKKSYLWLNIFIRRIFVMFTKYLTFLSFYILYNFKYRFIKNCTLNKFFFIFLIYKNYSNNWIALIINLNIITLFYSYTSLFQMKMCNTKPQDKIFAIQKYCIFILFYINKMLITRWILIWYL